MFDNYERTILGIGVGLLIGVFIGLFSVKDTELPTHVILNDWTNGKSISYVAYPEIEDDVLVLNEAMVTYIEDLKE